MKKAQGGTATDMREAVRGGYREFPCDLCGSREAAEVPHVREYTGGQAIHICKKCGFIYVKERRAYDEIAKLWSDQLFGKAYTSKTPLMLARHTYIAEFIDQSISLKDKLVCDIGAGEGQFLNIVKGSYGASVFGIVPSGSNCRIMAGMGIGSFKGTAEEYIRSRRHKKYKADVVTMMWTLENATSCRDLLKSAREILKDDGRLVVATGSRILSPFSKPLYLYFSKNPVDAHPSRFSANTLTSVLGACGFGVTHMNPYLNDSFVLCVIAKKRAPGGVAVKGDDFKEVYDFFERWHKDTMFYEKYRT